MARTVSMEALEKKIEKAQAEAAKAKAAYDKANAELKKLIAKRDELRTGELTSAILQSSKSYEEIMAFLGSEAK